MNIWGVLRAGCALGLLCARTAWAEERQFDLTGRTLSVGTPCARDIVISPDAALPAEHVHIVATADRAEELARLRGQSGEVAGFGASAQCPDSPRAERTLHVEIQIPGDMALNVVSSGAEVIRIGSLTTRLSVASHGSIDVTATHTGAVDFSDFGSGSLRIGQSEGPVQAVLNGSGTLAIETAHGPTLSAVVHGSGNMSIGHARFDRAKLESDGSGDMAIRTAWFGMLSIDNTGSGTVKIENGQAADTTIRNSGSGDVSIAAAIGRLTLAAHGSGDIKLPHVLTKVAIDASPNATLSIGQ